MSDSATLENPKKVGNGMLKGKKGIIVGVANKWSIAWAVAQACIREGAEVGFTYQGERVYRNLEKLFDEAELKNPFSMVLDVTDDSQLATAGEKIKKEFGEIDFILHAVAFAKREELGGHFIDTSRDGFHLAQNVSAYSLVALTKALEPALKNGGSVVALSYLGSEKVVKNYNVMGVAKAALECTARYLADDLGPKGTRVNVVSPGPIKTLSAAGIDDFSKMLDHVKQVSPLKKNTSADEVADTCVFLFSDYARGITAELIYVDGGYNKMGL